MPARLDVENVRSQFPALQRIVGDHPAVFLDGAAGSQVPRRVADAVSQYLLTTNANHGGPFATSTESDLVLAESHVAGLTSWGARIPTRSPSAPT